MLKANQQDVNLGNLKFGVPRNFKYILTNDYDTNLKINGLTLGCQSCTKAKVSKTELKPGESTEVDVIFTPGSTGINEKRVIVEYMTDRVKPGLTLTFKAIVNA